MYRVLLERAAEKDLARHSSEIHNRVIAAIQALATNPRPPGCRKLAGRPALAAVQTMTNMKSNKKQLSPKQREELLRALKDRFEKNMNRHKGLAWAKVQAKLEAKSEKLWR